MCVVTNATSGAATMILEASSLTSNVRIIVRIRLNPTNATADE